MTDRVFIYNYICAVHNVNGITILFLKIVVDIIVSQIQLCLNNFDLDGKMSNKAYWKHPIVKWGMGKIDLSVTQRDGDRCMGHNHEKYPFEKIS